MDDRLKLLTEKKHQLKLLETLPKEQKESLEDWLRVELTYSSNAIEGNTLTRIETAEVIEKGVGATISGKSLQEQLEAINHAKAVDFVRNLAIKRKKEHKGHQFITEQDIKVIHKIILTGIQDEYAGVYRQTDVYIKGRDIELPSPPRVIYLMNDLEGWFSYQKEQHPVLIAAEAHFKFVSIHPFRDGNGRTGRLLMNLILLLNDYPMTIIRKEDREEYLQVLYTGQKTGNMDPYYEFIYKSVSRSLDVYINASEGKPPFKALREEKGSQEKEPLWIGELAKRSGVSEHTIRYWTKEGLLKAKEITEGGYKLFDPSIISIIEEIKRLKKLRFTLPEIKEKLEILGTSLTD